MTITIRTMLALALSTATLAACGETPDQAETSAEAPEGPEGIAIENARLMLPPVSGNPGAVYFDVANGGVGNRVIRAVHVQGAESAMMHVTDEEGMRETLQVMVGPGSTTSFEPGGTHVMAMDLADTVVAGGETEVTLTFVGGDKISFPAEVRAAGDER